MKYFLHDNDLPIEIDVGNSIAIDTETTGLNLIKRSFMPNSNMY